MEGVWSSYSDALRASCAVEALVLSLWLAAAAVFLVLQPMLAPLRRAMQYGKIGGVARDGAQPSWFAQLNVPKHTFTHFYVVAVVLSVPALAAALLWGPCYVQRGVLGVPECSPPAPVLALAAVFAVHACRRLYECLHLHVFSPKARMHVTVYAGGVAHYVGASLTVFMPVREVSSWLLVAGTLLALAGNVWQNRAHAVLAGLRSAKRGSAASGDAAATRYAIPHGWGFDHVACPHYTAEICIYVGMLLMSGFSNRAALLMCFWVATQLSTTACRTRRWYRTKFAGEYPASIRAVVPWVC